MASDQVTLNKQKDQSRTISSVARVKWFHGLIKRGEEMVQTADSLRSYLITAVCSARRPTHGQRLGLDAFHSTQEVGHAAHLSTDPGVLERHQQTMNINDQKTDSDLKWSQSYKWPTSKLAVYFTKKKLPFIMGIKNKIGNGNNSSCACMRLFLKSSLYTGSWQCLAASPVAQPDALCESLTSASPSASPVPTPLSRSHLKSILLWPTWN